jgi:hypothetical protein
MPHIRVHNLTGEGLDSVRWYVPAVPREPIDFGALGIDEHSEYREVPVAYRFAEIEASGPAGSYTLRPYDYVGEEPLAEGRYTYHLGLAQGRLTIELEPTGGAP